MSRGGARPGTGGARRNAGRKGLSLEARRKATQKRVARWRWLQRQATQSHHKVYHRSKYENWGTPPDFFQALNTEFGFTLDAAASSQNALCSNYFTIADDALVQRWTGIVFVNPPYGRGIHRWIRKAYESAQDGATVVCLVKATPDTQWWHTYAVHGEIRFIPGRLTFVGAAHRAPFPSVLVIFRPPGDSKYAKDSTPYSSLGGS